MTTERVATRVSDAEMTRRWDAVRKLMRERGIQALVAYHTEDWLGGHARWFTDIPTHNGYGRSIVFHADDQMSARAAEILNQNGAVNFEQRSAQYRAAGYKSYDAKAPLYTSEQAQTESKTFADKGEIAIPIIVNSPAWRA